jgi:hypothetical protein
MSVGRICGVLVWAMVIVPGSGSNGQTTPVGARSVSLAGISAGLEELWAVYNNPAGLARYDHFSMATSLEQRFLMKELGYYSLALAVPARKGCLGMAALYSGFQSFIDQKITIGYGRIFGQNVLAGVSLVYIFQKAGVESEPIHQVSYEIGTLVLLSEKVSMAFATFNPFQLYFKSQDYATIPSIFKLGLSYYYNHSLLIHAELEKNLDYPAEIKTGLEYTFNKLFILRCGVSGLPFNYSFGAAFRTQYFMFEMAVSYHQYLGFSPLVTLQYDFK